MRILAVDVGTGTQDILAFDSTLDITNCPKLVMPSPTAILADKIVSATNRATPLLFTGFTMGGGPSKWALKQHLAAGLKAYATPDAARTFDDDPAELKKMGIIIVSPDEASTVRHAESMELKDIDVAAIGKALDVFGVTPEFDLVAVAVQDHGAAPSGTSDRTFRFEHMQHRLAQLDSLLAFTYLHGEVPGYLTRMAGAAGSLAQEQVLLMDTGFACVMGAQEDTEVSRHEDRTIVNLGNSHTIAFHLHRQQVLGMFEHHTRALKSDALDSMLRGLADGSLTNQAVFENGGHGAVVLSSHHGPHFIAAVGPQRGRISGSTLKPYFAVPYGDMMLSGCYGLVRACSLRFNEWRQEIEAALAREPS